MIMAGFELWSFDVTSDHSAKFVFAIILMPAT